VAGGLWITGKSAARALLRSPIRAQAPLHRNITKTPEEPKVQLQTSAKDQLRAFVSRIERLEEEKAALAADLREVYAEAKGTGFDVKALRKVISLRKLDENKRREEDAVLTTYLHALGMDTDAAESEAA
jgi:uncharacterized protein (UPF0335 family)